MGGKTMAFSVPGVPKGQGRPRATIRDGHATTYKDEKSRTYESFVALCCRQAMEQQGITGNIGHDECPSGVKVFITADFMVPKSFSKAKCKEAAMGNLRPTKKPDADNIAKSILDGITLAGFWQDDSIVVLQNCAKWYTVAEPKVDVVLAWEMV